MIKIKVYSLAHEDSPPKYIGTVKGEAGKSLADLRLRFEHKKIFNFQFQLWNVEDSCRVSMALESLNDIEDNVFLIPTAEVDNKLENSACKRPRLGNNTNLVHSQDNDVAKAEVLGVPEFPELPDSVPAEVGLDVAACFCGSVLFIQEVLTKGTSICISAAEQHRTLHTEVYGV